MRIIGHWEHVGIKRLVIVSVVMISLLILSNTAYAFEGKATYFTVASCIAEGNSGIMASGDPLNDKGYICALPHRNFGGFYRVTNVVTGKSVEVKHLDYGPGRRPRQRGVVIDLSKAAFEDIAEIGQGVVRVKVERI